MDVTNTANEVGKWFINKGFDFAYILAVASNSTPSYTSTEVDSLSKLEILTMFHLLVWSTFTVQPEIFDATSIFLV